MANTKHMPQPTPHGADTDTRFAPASSRNLKTGNSRLVRVSGR